MDKIAKKFNQNVKIVKDRGDLNKFPIEKTKYAKEINKLLLSDRGDSVRKCPDKKSVTDTKNTGVNKSKCTESVADRSELNGKNISDLAKDIKSTNAEDRKRIRDRYTLKLRTLNCTVTPSLNKKDEVKPKNLKVEIKNIGKSINKQLNRNNDLAQDMTNSSSYSGNSVYNPDKKSDRKPLAQRKPVVKTVLSKSDVNKMYKSVTFEHQQESKPTTLQIHIPTEVTKKNISELADNSSLKPKLNPIISRASVLEKPITMKKKSGPRRLLQNRHVTSPVLPDRTDNRSPPTEVARWTAINPYTKPYYEAWINTTLPTIARKNKEKIRLDNQITKTPFQKALEDRSEDLDSFMNYADEKFTGKIKIRQRQSNKNLPCR